MIEEEKAENPTNINDGNVDNEIIYFLSEANKHKRQKRIFKFFLENRPKIMLLFGSVRSGKTFVLTLLFIYMVWLNKNKGNTYLISGATQGSIFRNVLGDIRKLFGLDEIKLDRTGCFRMFGNSILVAEGGQEGNNGKIRGFTLSGAFVNEGTMLTDSFIQEVQNRLSDDSKNNGWLLIDTNPDNLNSYVYQNFVLKDGIILSSGRINIKSWLCNFTHNPYVSKEYKEGLIASTPSGHMFERMILGKWCNSSGLIYQDYNPNKHIIKSIEEILLDNEYVEYYVGGMDFGWEHYGSLVVFAVTNYGRYILVKEIVQKNKDIYWWSDRVHEAYNQFGAFTLWCDYARMEYIHELSNNNIMAYKANKAVIEGITTIASLLKQDKLFFLEKEWIHGHMEMGKYCWAEKRDGSIKNDEPLKEFDDCLDGCRYAIFSNIVNGKYGVEALDSMTL